VPDRLIAAILDQVAGSEQQRRRQPARFARLTDAWRTISVPMRIAAAVVIAVGLSAGAAMGWFVGQATTHATTLPSSDNSVAVYSLDYLGPTQDGSISQAYLGLVSAGDSSGE
jgi:hypothetical protein